MSDPQWCASPAAIFARVCRNASTVIAGGRAWRGESTRMEDRRRLSAASEQQAEEFRGEEAADLASEPAAGARTGCRCAGD